MTKHRSHSAAFKRQVAQEFVAGETLHGLSKRHDCGLSVAQGCRLMGAARSTFYDAPAVKLDDVEIAGRMQMICDEFEAYCYRRVGAGLRHQGVIVNPRRSAA